VIFTVIYGDVLPSSEAQNKGFGLTELITGKTDFTLMVGVVFVLELGLLPGV